MKKVKKIQQILMAIVFLFALVIITPNDALAIEPGLCTAENIRWASSSNRIYITGGATCTLTQIKALGSKTMPLDLINPVEKIWFLGANLLVQEGSKLIIHGSSAGGDVNELRLRSNNAADLHSFITVLADWGSIDINGSKITSWDESINVPDTEYLTYGRAYMRVRSRLDIDGVTPRESRMDIVNSDIGYLGYPGSEAYGLSWKVLGQDTIGPSIFDIVGVYGDVVNSKIHDNYFGVYTYGAEAMTFINNEVYNNKMYGLDPHDDSDNLVIDGNYVHHNGYHGIIGSQRCDNLTITNNISSYNRGNGIMLHRNTNESSVRNNELYNNGDSGIAIFDSHNNQISNNIAKFNKRGIRFSVGSSNNIIENNNFSENSTYGTYFYKGSDIPTSGDGKPKFNIIRNNTINSNSIFGARITGADFNRFENNTVTGNFKGIYMSADNPTGNTISSNNFSNNGRDYTIKLYDTQETTISNNIIDGSKYGVLLSNNSTAKVVNNEIKGSSKTGVRLQSGSSNNIISKNTITGNVRGVDLTGLSNLNTIKENNILNNTSYAVYIYEASENIFENNNLVGNKLNYYYTKYNSNNTIQNSDSFSLKVGDRASSMTVKDSQNYIFTNSKNIPTSVFTNNSAIIADQTNVSKSVVPFERLNFKVIPSTESVIINPVIWNTDNIGYKKWTTANNTFSSILVDYTVGDLAPNTNYNIIVNSLPWNSFTSNNNGEITFDYDSIAGSEIIFEVKNLF
jgi:mannuronan 5-epimerase